MKIRWIVAFLLTTSVYAQNAPPAPDEVVIPRKTEIFVSLERSLNTKTTVVGDRFHCRVSVPVTADDKIIIPPGSFMIGEVNYAKKPGRVKGKAEMMLFFDTIIFPDGKTRHIVARAQSAEDHISGSGDDEGKLIAASSQSDEVLDGAAKGTVVGAGIGAVADRSWTGLGVGSAVGAAGGAVLSLFKKGKHVTLPRGASITVQVDEDLVLVPPRPRNRGVRMKP